MGIRARIFSIAMTIAALATLALVIGADYTT
jgi:hypothetical protein